LYLCCHSCKLRSEAAAALTPSPQRQVAYKRAVLNAIDYLSKFGYTKEQVRCVHTHELRK